MAKKNNVKLTDEQIKQEYKGKPKFAYGIDIGGSGIKGAYVNLKKGKFASARVRIPTPRPATSDAVLDTVKALVERAEVPKELAIGITFPGPFFSNVLTMAANMDGDWSNLNLNEITSKKLGRKVYFLNDGDAAGLAEAKYADEDDFNDGLVLVLTLGTGIGSAIVYGDKLIPNLELGHLVINAEIPNAERFCSSRAFEQEHLTYKEYAERLQIYFDYCNFLFSPVKIIIGGGISKKADEFLPLIKSRAKLVPAKLLNSAGIIGAASFALDTHLAESSKK